MPLLLVLVGIAAYYNTLNVPELFDDESALSQNPTIRRLWPPSVPLNPPANSGTGGRPIANLTFALNYAWSGNALWSYHLANLAIHLGVALTLFGSVRRTLLRHVAKPNAVTAAGPLLSHSRATMLALIAATMWAVHPLATIAVTYLSQRTESLMAFFYLFTIYAFIRAADSRSRKWAAASVVACLLGMGSKEVMVTAPVAVLLYDRTFAAGTFRDAMRIRWKYYGCLAATWIPLAFLLGTGLQERLVGFDVGIEWWRYALTECRSILIYLHRSVWPGNLIFDYGPEFIAGTHIIPYIVALLLLAAGTLFALLRYPAAGFLAGWFFLVLAPTSSVIPIAAQSRKTGHISRWRVL